MNDRTILVEFRQGSIGAMYIMDMIFKQGWETKHTVTYCDCYGYYYTTLYLPS